MTSGRACPPLGFGRVGMRIITYGDRQDINLVIGPQKWLGKRIANTLEGVCFGSADGAKAS